MEFGRVAESLLSKIDFSLPKEPASNKHILKGSKTTNPKVYVGCAKWGRKDWIGKIYPKGTPEKDFLKLYVEHFNSIELNATSYKMPTLDQVKTWEEKAKGQNFLFCPKLVRYILPSPDMAKQQELIKSFLTAVSGFEKNLGPVFLLLQENFGPSKSKILYEFLHDFPKGHQLFVELRHSGWYSDDSLLKELMKEFTLENIGFIITDTAGRRDMTHMQLTIPKTFIRFVGNSLHKTDYARCDAWVKRIQYWLKNGLQELYFFMHMHDEATSPELISYFINELNEKCSLNLHNPDWRKYDK
ncbi:MAG: DUF72 domain-containing protein [Ginsengibacter sp.]